MSTPTEMALVVAASACMGAVVAFALSGLWAKRRMDRFASRLRDEAQARVQAAEQALRAKEAQHQAEVWRLVREASEASAAAGKRHAGEIAEIEGRLRAAELELLDARAQARVVSIRATHVGGGADGFADTEIMQHDSPR